MRLEPVMAMCQSDEFCEYCEAMHQVVEIEINICKARSEWKYCKWVSAMRHMELIKFEITGNVIQSNVLKCEVYATNDIVDHLGIQYYIYLKLFRVVDLLEKNYSAFNVIPCYCIIDGTCWNNSGIVVFMWKMCEIGHRCQCVKTCTRNLWWKGYAPQC